MKMICVKKYDGQDITIGKTYEILSGYGHKYFLTDNNSEVLYFPQYFMSIEEHRDKQLNEILK